VTNLKFTECDACYVHDFLLIFLLFVSAIPDSPTSRDPQMQQASLPIHLLYSCRPFSESEFQNSKHWSHEMKSTTYLHWTDATLDSLNVSVYLHQRLDNLISSEFIPSDKDPGACKVATATVGSTNNLTEFCQCLSPNLPAGSPLSTLDYSVSEALDRMFPRYDSGSSEFLLALVEHVVFFQPSLFFKDSDLIFRR
jgi:hypothetical protein